MRFFAVLHALLQLIGRVLDELLRLRKKRLERDYKTDIDAIENDPVDYANNQYGGLHDDKEQASPLPRDKTE